MAGGIGSRFWPFSRQDKPKQFLDILHTGKTLIQKTYERFVKIIPKENILVVTHNDYLQLVKDQLPEIQNQNILLEPYRRNTAPCIAYALSKIKMMNSDAVMVVAPSDHQIIKEEDFLQNVMQGLDFVSKTDNLLTLGIKPSRPETGYGYIQIENGKEYNKTESNIFKKVKTFTEKPDFEMAKVFVESGEFFWNSGLFFWSARSIENAFEQYLPDIYELFKNGETLWNTEFESKFIEEIYSRCRNISIDYGIMEKASNAYMIISDFGWSDLGTWGSLYEHLEKDENGNHIGCPNTFTYDSKNCIIKANQNKCVVVQGLEDYVIIDTNDVLLICRTKEEQQIRQFVTDVKLKLGDKYI